ncbi:MaoC family dehydratase [Caldovatus aquaticus]|uniref:MaoC family dehydratase n=1 Tax=Caldovatus aquaticus TaxID=2865671 RepID=A0ABS7F312_9PROT|nr:MaoC family dehydratase [Caldovatus aquaticus]MBW8269903.1 MaoC family dehydratase [Caldovatus aquaticus]
MASQGEDGRLFLEDLSVGRRFAAGPVRVSPEEVLAYAARFDPQPFHTDPATAGHPVLGGHSASGWHTASLTMRMVTEALPLAWGVVGGGGEIAWPRPVRPGDTLRVEAEVLETGRSRSRPDRGWARLRVTTLNQRDEPVQVLVTRLIVPSRVPDSGTSC